MKKKQHSSGLLQVEFVCPKCGTWVTAENRKVENTLYLPLDDDQMVLFV